MTRRASPRLTALALVFVPLVLGACNPFGPSRLSPLEATQGHRDAAFALDADVDGLSQGHRLMAQGEYDHAIRAYHLAAAEQGLTVDTLSALGSANLHLGRLGQAETLLRQALGDNPDFVPALNNLGVVLMEQGNFGEARRLFERAYAVDSGATDAIRDNLRLAIARMENPMYDGENDTNRYDLIRRGPDEYVLLETL